MKQQWNIDELEEHFELLPPEIEWLGDNADHNHLGKAIQLKFFQFEGRFPEGLKLAKLSPDARSEHRSADLRPE